MRLFLGIDTGPVVARSARTLIDELKARASRLAPRARISWVAPERIHITVRFLGEVAGDRVDAIRRALGSDLPVEPFRVEIGGLGAFPDRGRPRVLWAGLTAGHRAMVRLAEMVSKRLTSIDLPPDDRAFNPHVTLARVRESAGLRTAALLDGLEDAALGSIAVAHVTLFESRAGSHQPEYVPLLRSRLAGAPRREDQPS